MRTSGAFEPAERMALAVLVAAMVVAVAIVPQVLPPAEPDTFGVAAPPTTGTAVADATPADSVAGLDVSSGTVASERTATPVEDPVTVPTTEPVRQASRGPVPPPADHAQLVSIQTVPVVRDLVMMIAGRPVATDGRGVIDLERDDFRATVEVVGVSSDPPLRQISFVQWSDGSTDPIRSIADMPGPVIQLGLEIRHRVVVDAGPEPAPDSVEFVSDQVGAVTLPVGRPAPVVARRATAIDGALIVEDVDYRLAAGEIGDPGRIFLPNPESVWEIAG